MVGAVQALTLLYRKLVLPVNNARDPEKFFPKMFRKKKSLIQTHLDVRVPHIKMNIFRKTFWGHKVTFVTTQKLISKDSNVAFVFFLVGR